MKQENLFKKLGSILNELNEQYQFLSQNPEQLNELELELFYANADFLTDHIQIIKKLNSQQAMLALPTTEVNLPIELGNNTVAQQAEIETTYAEVDVEQSTFVNDNISPTIIIDDVEDELVEQNPLELEIKQQEKADSEKEIFKFDNEDKPAFEFILNDHEDSDSFDFEEKNVNEIFDRPISIEEQHIIEQKKKLRAQVELAPEDAIDDEIGPEPFLVKQEKEEKALIPLVLPIFAKDIAVEEAPSPAISGRDAVEEDPSYKPTLKDILAGKNTAANLNAVSSGTATKDLKQRVSLNDKLLYIKDLFNGYNLAYAEAIDLANKLPNFEAADNFFKKNYAAKNNWAAKQATVDQFYELLNQRFKTLNP